MNKLPNPQYSDPANLGPHLRYKYAEFQTFGYSIFRLWRPGKSPPQNVWRMHNLEINESAKAAKHIC